MKTLYIIPARGGSKGIPKKNIKPLNKIPLLFYSIDLAREFCKDEDICISTDDNEIIECVKNGRNLNVPFVRPAELATDNAGTYPVLLHALDFYKKNSIEYDTIVLLQPTSPFRRIIDVKNCLTIFKTSNVDMVVSVCESKSNPYFNLYEENEEGFLEKSKKGNFERRQDCPPIYEFNGAIYLLNVNSLLQKEISKFERVKKYVMPRENSLDIDTQDDFDLAEYYLKKRNEI